MKHKIKKTIQDSRFRIQDGGFTIIEMVIVVAIIGLLSSVVLTGLNKSRQKARDVRRISHILQIQHELEAYRTENNEYLLQSPEGNINVVLTNAPIDPLDGEYQYESIDSEQGYRLGTCLEQNRPAGIVSTYTGTGLNPTNAGKICDCDDPNSYCMVNPL